MMRRYGDKPVQGQAYTPRPGVYVLLPLYGNILLTRQNNTVVDIPGGGIDPGESTLPALYREVLEETGWSISKPRRLGAYRRFTYMPDYGFHAEKICHIYVARPVRRICPPLEENHSAFFTPIEHAAQRLENAGDADFCKRLLGLIPLK
jgi:8-oxo-dGTP diphosphatase